MSGSQLPPTNPTPAPPRPPTPLGSQFVPRNAAHNAASGDACWGCASPANGREFEGWFFCGPPSVDGPKFACGGFNEDGSRVDPDGCRKIHPSLRKPTPDQLAQSQPMYFHQPMYPGYGYPPTQATWQLPVHSGFGAFGGGLGADRPQPNLTAPLLSSGTPQRLLPKRSAPEEFDNSSGDDEPAYELPDLEEIPRRTDDDEESDTMPTPRPGKKARKSGKRKKNLSGARAPNFTIEEKAMIVRTMMAVCQSAKGADMDKQTLCEELNESFSSICEHHNVRPSCDRTGDSLFNQFTTIKRSHSLMKPVYEKRLQSHQTGIERGGKEDKQAAIEEYESLKSHNQMTWHMEYFGKDQVFDLMLQYMSIEKEQSHTYQEQGGRKGQTPRGCTKSKKFSRIDAAKDKLLKSVGDHLGDASVSLAIRNDTETMAQVSREVLKLKEARFRFQVKAWKLEQRRAEAAERRADAVFQKKAMALEFQGLKHFADILSILHNLPEGDAKARLTTRLTNMALKYDLPTHTDSYPEAGAALEIDDTGSEAYCAEPGRAHR